MENFLFVFEVERHGFPAKFEVKNAEELNAF
jgi:hypothetical protein